MDLPHALVLTADPATGALGPRVADRVRPLLPGAARGRWLVPGAAFESLWNAGNPDEAVALRTAVAVELSELPIDVSVVPAAAGQRAKKLLVADMESTLIAQELIDELADVAARREEIAALTRATMRGDIDFAASLRHRVSLLAGLTTDDLARVAERISPMPGAERLVREMKAAGARTALVSGGFTVFTERVAEVLGLETQRGNVLEIRNGRLTGHVHEPILDAAGKRDVLLELAADADLDLSQVLAVGDGANDLLMLDAAGLGVAFRAKPVVRAAMRARPGGAVIEYADLTALLHLQGLPT